MEKIKVVASMEATVKIKTKPVELEIPEANFLESKDFLDYIKVELADEIATEVGFYRDEITIENLEYKIGE